MRRLINGAKFRKLPLTYLEELKRVPILQKK